MGDCIKMFVKTLYHKDRHYKTTHGPYDLEKGYYLDGLDWRRAHSNEPDYANVFRYGIGTHSRMQDAWESTFFI
jgi:hypothetical protein